MPRSGKAWGRWSQRERPLASQGQGLAPGTKGTIAAQRGRHEGAILFFSCPFLAWDPRGMARPLSQDLPVLSAPFPGNTRLDGSCAQHVEKKVSFTGRTSPVQPFSSPGFFLTTLFAQKEQALSPARSGIRAHISMMNDDTEGPTGPRPSPVRVRENTLKKPGSLALAVRETNGLTLLGYLARHCSCPAALIHRCIRTGQIRLNGCRVHPMTPLNRGDALLVPGWLGRFAQGRVDS